MHLSRLIDRVSSSPIWKTGMHSEIKKSPFYHRRITVLSVKLRHEKDIKWWKNGHVRPIYSHKLVGGSVTTLVGIPAIRSQAMAVTRGGYKRTTDSQLNNRDWDFNQSPGRSGNLLSKISWHVPLIPCNILKEGMAWWSAVIPSEIIQATI